MFLLFSCFSILQFMYSLNANLLALTKLQCEHWKMEYISSLMCSYIHLSTVHMEIFDREKFFHPSYVTVFQLVYYNLQRWVLEFPFTYGMCFKYFHRKLFLPIFKFKHFIKLFKFLKTIICIVFLHSKRSNKCLYKAFCLQAFR